MACHEVPGGLPPRPACPHGGQGGRAALGPPAPTPRPPRWLRPWHRPQSCWLRTALEATRLAGASHEQVASAVQSTVGVRRAGDLTTVTAAAATALRGAATMKQRVQREVARSNVNLLPDEKGHSWSPDVWCKEGELLKRTRKGDLHMTKVSVYINKRSQVMLKLKSKHIGGALSKNNKSVVYGVYSELPTWVIEPGKAVMDEKCYFGLSTAQGIVEFECQDGTSKQNWSTMCRTCFDKLLQMIVWVISWSQ